MRVDGNRRQALDRRYVAQVLAEARFVDCKIVVERQQNSRNHALGNIVRVPWHGVFLPISDSCLDVARVAEFGRKAIGSSPYLARPFLQCLYG